VKQGAESDAMFSPKFPLWSQRHLGPTRRILAALVVLSLLWAQSLGQWHGVLHDGHAQPGVASEHQMVVADQSTAISALARLFSSHEDAADCLFFDQLSHGDAAAPLQTLTLPPALLPVVLQYSHALFIARWHAQFQARGPPLSAEFPA
jgi:hypothetical protein